MRIYGKVTPIAMVIIFLSLIGSHAGVPGQNGGTTQHGIISGGRSNTYPHQVKAEGGIHRAAPVPATRSAVSVAQASQTPTPKAATPEDGQQAAAGNVTVPAGTRVLVRTVEPIDSRQHKAGHRFTATLEADLVGSGVTVAPRGSNVYGRLAEARQAGRLAGRSEITLEFTDIMVNNALSPISASGIQAVTEGTGRDTAGKVARGAAIGALIDGSSGARTGAKVGAGAAILTRGQSVNIPPGTLLEFTLAAPFTP